MYHKRSVLVILLLLLLVNVSNAATYYSRVASGNFSAVGSWSINTNGTPTNATALTASDIFIIQSGNNINLSGNQSAAQVTVQSGGTLSMNGNRTLTCPTLTINSGGTLAVATRQFTFTGNLTNSGAITGTTGFLTANTGTFINNGSIALTTGRIVRTTGPLTNNGTITLGAGQFTATSGTFTNSATGTMTVTGTATITLGTGNFVNSNTSASVNFGSSAIGLTGTTRNVGGFTTTGAVTPSNASGTITVTGNINAAAFTKSGAGTINMGTGFTHTFTGIFALGTTGSVNGGSSTINVNVVSATAWTGTGTVFARGNSTVVFGGGGNQTITATGTNSFHNLTYAGSGTKTMATYTVYNIFELEGTAVVSAAPTYEVGSGLVYNTSDNRTAGVEWVTPFTRAGGVTIATMNITTNNSKVFNVDIPLTINLGATLTPASGHTFSFGGDFTNSGTWTTSNGAVTIALERTTQSIGKFATTGLVSMTKTAGTATLAGNVDGAGLTVNGAGTLNMGGGLTHTFSGNWTLTTGTFNLNNSLVKVAGSVTATGVTFQPSAGTIEFNGGAQVIPAATYHNVILSGSGSKSITGTISVNTIEIKTGPTFDLGPAALLNVLGP